MATSKSPLSLYAETPEEQEPIQAYKEAQQKLIEALEGRRQLFDPTLLAMAQGFLSPTKTGSFGEALGNVAAQLGPVQAAEDKRAQELAKMRYELASQNVAQQRATRGEKEFRGLLGRMGGEQGVNVPQGAPVEGDAFMPSRDSSALVSQATAGARSITPSDIARLKKLSPEDGKILEDMVKAQQDRFAISMNGIVFDKSTGQYLNIDIPGQKQEDFATPYGTFKMTPNEYAKFQKAEASGEGREWLDNFRRPGGMTTGALGAPGRMTVTESEAAKESAVTTAQERAKLESKRYEDIINKGALASAQLPRLKGLYSVVTGPNAEQYLGIFRGPKFAEAIGLLAEGAVPNIREAFTNVGLDKTIKAEQLAVAQQVALINSEMRKILRSPGEGAQSDLENRMALAAGVEMTDPAKGMAKKIQFLQAKAEFENEVAKELNKSKMTPTDFVLSPESKYQQLLQNYERKLGNILSVSQRQSASSKTGSSSYEAARQKLNEKLGIK